MTVEVRGLAEPPATGAGGACASQGAELRSPKLSAPAQPGEALPAVSGLETATLHPRPDLGRPMV